MADPPANASAREQVASRGIASGNLQHRRADLLNPATPLSDAEALEFIDLLRPAPVVPVDADLVFDVRCLPNPYWKPDLRDYSGLDQPVVDYLFAQADVEGADVAAGWQQHPTPVSVFAGVLRQVDFEAEVAAHPRGQHAFDFIGHRIAAGARRSRSTATS